MAEGIQWDNKVFGAEETKAAAELLYPIDARMSDTRAREALLRRIAFRAGAAWRAHEEAGG